MNTRFSFITSVELRNIRVSPRRIHAVCCLVALLAGASSLQSQSGQPTQTTQPVPPTAPARSLPERQPPLPPNWRGASVSADTGRMAPGHLDFRRYRLPEDCLSALHYVQSRLYRHRGLDTVRFEQRTDTFATVAVDTGRACYATLNPSTVPPQQLDALVRLQLAIGDDAQAYTTAERLLAMRLSADDRAHALYEIATAYIQAKPMRTEPARTALAQLDSLGATYTRLRVEAHLAFLRQWVRRFNTAEIRKAAEPILLTAEVAPISIRGMVFQKICEGYLEYDDAMAYDGDHAGRPALKARARAIFQEVGDGQGGTAFDMLCATPEDIRDLPLGKPLVPLVAKWTINHDTTATQNSGRVTLVVPVQQNRPDFGVYAMLRRLAKQYGTQGLDIVLVTQTLGYSPGSLVQTGEEEVKSIETFFRTFQNVPAKVVVEETAFVIRDSDKRRLPQPTAFQSEYQYYSVVLVGRDGKVVWTKLTGMLGLNDEAQLDAYVKRAIGKALVGVTSAP